MRRALLILAFTIIAAKDGAETIAVHGWLDGDYAWNGRRVPNHLNFFDGVGTTAEHADEPALNAAALDVVRDPKPFGFHFTLAAGDSMNVVHLAETHRIVRYVYQASATWSRGAFGAEAGIYPSHIGFEGFFSKDNWNYTRGWLGEFSPYYQSGVRTSYAFNQHWSAQVHVLNGWQNVTARARKAVGTQVAYNDARLSATYNTFLDRHRKFGDLVVTYRTTPKLTTALSLDNGGQQPAHWNGVSLWARYALDARNAVAARVDRFRDPEAGISGTAQALESATLTYEVHARKALLLKFEARRDRSSAPVFHDSSDQTLAIASMVVSF